MEYDDNIKFIWDDVARRVNVDVPSFDVCFDPPRSSQTGCLL